MLSKNLSNLTIAFPISILQTARDCNNAPDFTLHVLIFKLSSCFQSQVRVLSLHLISEQHSYATHFVVYTHKQQVITELNVADIRPGQGE